MVIRIHCILSTLPVTHVQHSLSRITVRDIFLPLLPSFQNLRFIHLPVLGREVLFSSFFFTKPFVCLWSVTKIICFHTSTHIITIITSVIINITKFSVITVLTTTITSLLQCSFCHDVWKRTFVTTPSGTVCRLTSLLS